MGNTAASLGELERRTMECLWSTEAPMSAPDLRAALSDRDLALTTIYTVLTRLEQKGFVERDEGRPRRFRASDGRAEHAASVMHDVLEQAADPDAVLTRFVGSVSAEEASLLRRLLRKRPVAPTADQT
jgi:predicted transcriptional regulator